MSHEEITASLPSKGQKDLTPPLTCTDTAISKRSLRLSQGMEITIMG